MAGKSVVRQDVVEISWDIEESPFGKLMKVMQEMECQMDGTLDGARDGLGEMAKETQNATKEFSSLVGEVEELDGQLSLFDEMAGGISDVEQESAEAADGFDELADKIKKAEAEGGKLHDELGDLGDIPTDRPRDGLDEIGQSADTASGKVSKLGDGFGKLMQGLGVMTLINKGMSMLNSSFGGAFGRIDTMEQFDRTMTSITGDSEKVADALDQARDSVTGTGYALDTAAKNIQGIVTSDVNKDIVKATGHVKGLTDAVSYYGDGSNEALDTVADAYAKMTASGKASAEQVNRLTDNGIPAMMIFADATGRSVEDVQKAMSKGEVSAEEFTDTLTDAFENGTKEFQSIAGAAKEAGASWQGTLDNFGTYMVRGVTNIIGAADEGLAAAGLPGIRDMVKSTGGVIEDGLNFIAEKIPAGIAYVRDFVDSFRATSLPADVGRMIGSLKDMGTQVLDTAQNVLPKLEASARKAGAFLSGGFSDALEFVAEDLLPPFLKGVGWLADNLDDLAPIALSVAAGFKAWKAVEKAEKYVGGLGKAIEALGKGAKSGEKGMTGLLVNVGKLGKTFLSTQRETGSFVKGLSGMATQLGAMVGPTGLFMLGATAAAALGVALYRHVTEPARQAEENMNKIGKAFGDGFDIMSGGQADLSKYAGFFGGINVLQEEVKASTAELQDQINAILAQKIADRASLTQQDLDNLENYYAQLIELNNQNIGFEQYKMDAIVEKNIEKAGNTSVGEGKYINNMSQSVADVRAQGDLVIAAIEENEITQLAALDATWEAEKEMRRSMLPDQIMLETEKYNDSKKAIMDGTEAQISEIEKSSGAVAAAYADGYSKLITQDTELGSMMEKLRADRLAADKDYAKDVSDIEKSNAYNENDRIVALADAKTNHLHELEKISTNFTNGLDEKQQDQLGKLMSFSVEAEIYGGEIDAATQQMVDGMLDAWSDMPAKAKETMGNVVKGELEGVEERAPDLYKAMETQGEGTLDALKEALGVHSPSVYAHEALSDFMLGGENGAEEGGTGLMAKIQEIGTGILEALTQSLGGLENTGGMAKFGEDTQTSLGAAYTAITAFEINTTPIWLLVTTGIEGAKTKVTEFGTTVTSVLLAAVLETQTQLALMTAEFDALAATLEVCGINAMDGFINGILSKKEELLAVAAEMAAIVPNTINSVNEIQSPSRVLFEAGQFTGEGYELGLREMIPGVGEASALMAEVPKASAFAAPSFLASPQVQEPSKRGGNNYTTNHNTPQFTLTIGGNASAADRNMERQVKEWIIESFSKLMNDAGRGGPVPREA